MTKRQIAGEDYDAIGAALLLMKLSEPDDEGMVKMRLRGPIAQLAPLFRALMRVEAHLLLADAADFPDTEESRRTGDQRRADALVEIAKRLRILSVAGQAEPGAAELDGASPGAAR